MWKDSNFILSHFTQGTRPLNQDVIDCTAHRNKLFHSHVALEQRQQLVSANEERYVASGHACALHVCVLGGVW